MIPGPTTPKPTRAPGAMSNNTPHTEEIAALKATVSHLAELLRKSSDPLAAITFFLEPHDAASCVVFTRCASYINPGAEMSWWRW